MEEKILLPETDAELLGLCKVETFKAKGKGGQHVNKTDSAVRVTLLKYRLAVTSQKERSQYLNKKECLRKLRLKVARLNARPPKRIPTRVPPVEKEKRLLNKKRQGERKKRRVKIPDNLED